MTRSHHETSAHPPADICRDGGCLAETVAEFIATGHHLAEPLVLITTPNRRDAPCARLSERGSSWSEPEELRTELARTHRPTLPPGEHCR